VTVTQTSGECNTNQLTPSGKILRKLIIAYLVKTFSAFYGIRRFMNVSTGFIHRSLTVSSNFSYRNHLHQDSNLGHLFVVACFCKLLFKTNNFGLVVEVLGFGAVWICKSIPTFRRNMLSPSSEPEVTTYGSRRPI
jgi:hypothetical protein